MTVRRYFDRHPGSDTNVGDITRIINNYTFVTEDTVSDEVRALLNELSASVLYASEIFSNVSGVVTPTVTDRAVIDVSSTAGAWSLNLAEMPQTYPAEVWVKIDSSGSHTPTFPANVIWDGGSAPSGSLWATGKRAVIRFTRVPFTNQIMAKLVVGDDTPPVDDIAPVTPVTPTFQYSTSSNRASLTALSGATLPAGQVAVVVGPLSSDIAYVDIWHNHSGGLPAVGSEATVDSYVGRRSVFPYDLLGGTTSAAVMWDTRFDPTGNSRAGYNPAGSNTIDVRYTYVDDTTSTGTVTFNTGNPTAPSDPYAVSYGSHTYVGSSPSTDVTVPNKTHRGFAAVFIYRANRQFTGATLGGNAATVIGSYWNSIEGHGLLAVWMAEGSMPAAGTRALVPTRSGSLDSISVNHVHYWLIEGAPNLGVIASATPYNNGTAALTMSVPDISASAAVFTVAGQDGAGSTFTNNWTGTTLEPRLSTDSSYDVSSQAEWTPNNGVGGDLSITWTPSFNKSRGVILVASANVTAPPTPDPITPGTPTLTTPTKPGDNQLRTTWTATSDAVAYEGRIGTTNPPTTSPISLGNVTNWTRSGLSPSTLYYMQVRAVSSTNTRSDWSAAVSGTTNASTVVIPPIGQDRFVHGYFNDLRVMTHTFDRALRTDGILVPNWHGHYNLGPEWGNVVYATRTDADVYPKAVNQWSQNATARPSYITDMGPKTFITTKLSFTGHHSRSPQPSNSELAALDLARSGSTGTDNRNAGWRAIGSNLSKWQGQVFVSLSHESNGYWYANYSGVNPKLVGSATLAGVPNSQFGTAMGAAIRQVAVDGNLATVHKLAAQHAASEIWSTGPNVIICYVLADGQFSIPPGAGSSGGMSSVWQDAAHPSPQFFDVLGLTSYCRGGANPVYKGSGDVNSTANWTFYSKGANQQGNLLAQQWNRPVGWWELGCNWDVFDWPPTYTAGPNDNQSSIYWKYQAEELPKMDVAFITYWNSGSDKEVGSTYQLPEANYGYGKWTGTNPLFPKTTQMLRNIYG